MTTITAKELETYWSNDYDCLLMEAYGYMVENGQEHNSYDPFLRNDPEWNAEKHISNLMDSILTYGIREPIELIGNLVVEGHHRAMAAIRLGMTDIPVIDISEDD